jgi:tRNA A-37 threonylcarbamoyl transferase component Bud32
MLLEPTPESEEMIHGWPASRIRCYIPWLVRGKMDPLSRRAHDFGELSLLMPAERPSSLLGAAAKLWHRLAFTLAIALALVFGGGRFVRPPAPAHFTAPSTDDSQLARTELRLVPERMQAPAIASKRAHPDRDAVDVRTPTQTHKSRVLAPVDRGLTTASTKPGRARRRRWSSPSPCTRSSRSLVCCRSPREAIHSRLQPLSKTPRSLMDDTLAGTMNDLGAETERGGAGSPHDPTELGPLVRKSSLELETARVRLAQELFGVSLDAPRIGRFRVLEKLGEGGMGQVYAAFDPELDRRVAIKVLHSEHSETHEGRERLLREAQALARVSHPNVVQVFEVGVHQDHVFVAMEYVRGESMAARLEHSTPSEWSDVLRLFIAAGHGLAAVHAAGLVHRDFKPANTVVGEDGRARILDFGLARVSAWSDDEVARDPESRSDRLEESLTAMGSIIGTPAYMAPEVFMGQRADARSDQYSYCTALFEGLYGFRPHAGETLAALATAKLSGSVRPPPAGTKVPAWLHAAVLRGLALAPERRWPTMVELLAELGRDRQGIARRWMTGAAGLALLALTSAAVYQGIEQQRVAAGERDRAELAEREAATQHERASRSAFERSVIAEAERAAEVMRLAQTSGRERDALVLGIQTLAPHAPEFATAPLLAIEGVAEALPALIPSRTIPARGERVLDLALSSDGRSLATVDTGQALRLYDADAGTLRASAPWSGKWAQVAFSPDDTALLISGDRCMLHDPDTGALIREIASCKHGQFSPDSSKFYGVSTSADQQNRITAWEAVRGAELWTAPVAANVEALLVDPRGHSLFAALPGGNVQITAVEDGRLLTVLRAPAPVKGATAPDQPGASVLAASPDGKRLAVSGWGTQLWNTDDRRHLGTLIPAGPDLYYSLAFSRDGHRLLASKLGGLRVFDTDSAVLSALTEGTSLGSPTALDDGTLLATDHDGMLQRWADQGALVYYTRAEAPDVMPLELAVSANRARAATGRDAIRLWSVRDPRWLARWQPPVNTSKVIAAGPIVVTEHAGGATLVHDRRTGAVLARLVEELTTEGHDASAPRLRAVHRFENTIWTRRGDWVRLHDLRDGRLIRRQRRSWAPIHEAWLAPVGSPRISLMGGGRLARCLRSHERHISLHDPR